MLANRGWPKSPSPSCFSTADLAGEKHEGLAIDRLHAALGHCLPGRRSRQHDARQIGAWRQNGPGEVLTPSVARALGADDYHSVELVRDDAATGVGLFLAWYADQGKGGVHSPEICLPGSGWEIAWLERTDVSDRVGSDAPFNINRAIIQKGETRMMVFYWFEQKGRKVAWDFAAKFYLMVDGVRTGRTDGALVRLTTLIGRNEADEEAEARLMDVLMSLEKPLPRFAPGDEGAGISQ